MPQTLQAGIVGLGILGNQYADFLRRHPAVSVAAVADVRRDVASALAAQLGAQAYADYREMLKRHALDLVVVATPDPLHREPVLTALTAGVPNVIQEKPLAGGPTWPPASRRSNCWPTRRRCAPAGSPWPCVSTARTRRRATRLLRRCCSRPSSSTV